MLGLPATILRPVAFMENFATSGFPLAMFFGMIKATMGATRKLQFVAVSDIGWFAARPSSRRKATRTGRSPSPATN